MMKKSYVLYVILSLAGLLLATDAVQAHGGRRGCHGGCYGGCYGGYSCGCYGGSYGGCYGGYSYGGCVGRYAYGGCHGGCYGGYVSRGCYGGHGHGGCYGGYGGCYGGSYAYGGNAGGYASGSYGYVNGSYPGTYVMNPNGIGTVVAGSPGDSSSRLSFFQSGDTNDGGPAIQTNAARIRVTLPDPQARVWVDGQQTSSTGMVRMFHTPELTSGGSYRIKVSWMEGGREVTKERTCAVNPGQTASLDFGQGRSGSEEAQESQPGTPAADGTPIRVIVPDAQANVWINDRKMSATGTTRALTAPALRSGDGSSYRVRASWTKDGQVVTQERTVSPTAGQSSVVDFTRPEADRTPPRQQEQ